MAVRRVGGPYPSGSVGELICALALRTGISPRELAECDHADLLTMLNLAIAENDEVKAAARG